ncbi:MAG: EF-hand domain-containing protein [Methylocystis sp.]|jgi:Ca2+-binding EF-hand superfamily protein
MTKAGKFALCFAISVAPLAATDTVFAASRHAVAAGEGQVRQLLLLMDRDQNGQVSRAEFMGFMEAEFNALDVDRSGELNPEELSRSRIGVGGEGQVRQLLRLMDKDRNGQVSRAEFMGFMEAEFNRLDVDRSGELTPGELSHTILRISPTHVNPHK